GIGEDGGLGPDAHRGEHVFTLDLQGISLEPERELEAVHQLEGIGPDLEGAAFVAEGGRPAARDGKEAPFPRGTVEGEAAPREGEAGHRLPGECRGRRNEDPEGGEKRASPVGHALPLLWITGRHYHPKSQIRKMETGCRKGLTPESVMTMVHLITFRSSSVVVHAG